MLTYRYQNNPVLKPDPEISWEANAVFNGCPVKKGDKIYLLYRAISLPRYQALSQMTIENSEIGIAESNDGVNFSNRRHFIFPEKEWEKYGCEDPRVTKLGNKYFIFYTALSEFPFSANGIRVAVAISKDLQKVDTKHQVTPFNAKAMALFPEKIKSPQDKKEKIWAILTIHTDQPPARICLVSFEKEEDIWNEKFWKKWYEKYTQYELKIKRSANDHIEVGSPPIKTKKGWLIFYSHIQNYFSPQKIFGIEAILLDKDNPQKIISKTKYPLLVSRHCYEKYGLIPNVIFPSGAIKEEDIPLSAIKAEKTEDETIRLYYGAADSTCCFAFVKTDSLLKRITEYQKNPLCFKRISQEPILSPKEQNLWESRAVFNPAAIYLKGKFRLVYRAMSQDNTSSFGYAETKDGKTIDYRSPNPIYYPRTSFEQKFIPNGNSGAEDARIVKIGSKIYMTFTAFDGKNPPRVMLSRIKEADFLAKNWRWSDPVPISAPMTGNKNTVIFPEKIKGKYLFIHRTGNDIDLAYSDSLDFNGNTFLDEYRWIQVRKGWWDSVRIGAAASPIKTEAGWVLIYHGISEDGVYRLGAVLLDKKNPEKILSRLVDPLFEPELSWEREGEVPNVVFPCNAVLKNDDLFIFYGGADKYIGSAKLKMVDLLEALKFYKD
ncbi:MAG: hypothetical protein PHQ20_03765 [Candidatus Moranbacteria bacterium]|nr:hypothetical protein [Candidatus Moranbacteria bacterium]